MKQTKWYLAMSSYMSDYDFALCLLDLKYEAMIDADMLYRGCRAIKITGSEDQLKKFEAYLLRHGLWVDDLEAYLANLEKQHRRYQLIKALLNV